MDNLINDIAYLIAKDNLDKKDRHRVIVNKRIYLFSILGSYKIPLSDIGKIFNRHHATIIYGIKQYHKLKSVNDYNLLIDTAVYVRFFEIRKKYYKISKDEVKNILKTKPIYFNSKEAKLKHQINNVQNINKRIKKIIIK